MSNVTALVRDNFDSISEGCFLVMPGKKRHMNTETTQQTKKQKGTTKVVKIAQRAEQDSQLILNDGFQKLFNGEEPEDAMLNRKKFFEETWNKLDKEVSDILLDMNQTAVDNICRFVDKEYEIEQSMVSLPFHEIPTGLVFAGINTPDHDTQFSYIASKLKEAPTDANQRTRNNFVCLLQAKDCANIKNMFKTMIERFLENTVDPLSSDLEHDINMDNGNEGEEEDGEDGEDGEDDEDMIRTTERAAVNYRLGGVAAKPSKCLPYDMKLLEGWYNHHQKKYENKPNLVVILQDFESFEPALLQDFFTICSEYRSRLPFICIMGIATSIEILHQSLNKSTIGLLRIEKFKLEQSKVWFFRVIGKVFLDSTTTLKFGKRPYKFLLDRFLLYDFSMAKVTANLKYALMHHFYGNSLSIFFPLLCKNELDMSITMEQWLEQEIISEHHTTHIRMLGSFRKYIESLVDTEPRKALRLLEDDEFLLIDTIPALLCDIKIYQLGFKLGFHLLVLLQGQFPSFTGLKKADHTLLLDVLETENFVNENGDIIKRLVTFVRKINTEHVGRLLKSLRVLIEQADYAEIHEPYLEQLDEWEMRYQHLMETGDNNKKAKTLEGMVLQEEGSRRTATAKKVQNESIEHLKERGTEASKIAIAIGDWCEETLRRLLRSFKTLPLHELVYYTEVALHQKSFASQPRASAQTALTQSQHYINCTCCNSEKSDLISASEHDTCILYKLYLECGRMINLYDWFVAFSCIIEREKRPANHTLEENEAQARFIRSVAELQFLGFIKPTQRKTDHVIRLTWSNI